MTIAAHLQVFGGEKKKVDEVKFMNSVLYSN